MKAPTLLGEAATGADIGPSTPILPRLVAPVQPEILVTSEADAKALESEVLVPARAVRKARELENSARNPVARICAATPHDESRARRIPALDGLEVKPRRDKARYRQRASYDFRGSSGGVR